MTNNKTTYRRLGDYIREVDVRNKDLQCTNLLGLSIAKKFIPSIANMVGTDLRPYKIVKHNQFAYVPVTSRNGEKITVALYTDDEPAIISQAYVVFEIVGTCDTVETVCTPSLQCNQLLPEYLMMWFRRAEFDRYARFHSHGSAREVFDWEEMCNVMLPVPSIEEQRSIVNRYKAIENRIANNKQTIAKLEEAAQALYRKMFVDDIDPENLPEGWRKCMLTEVADIQYGFAFNGEHFNSDELGMPIIRIRNIQEGCTNDYTTEKASSKHIVHSGEILIGMDGDFHVNQWLSKDAYLVQRSCSIRPKKHENNGLIYQALLEPIKRFQDSIVGATVIHLGKKNIDEIQIIMPNNDICWIFQDIRKCIFEMKCEVRVLKEILSSIMI